MTAIRHLMVLAFVALLGLAACAPVYRNHGFIPAPEDLSQVVVGQTTVDELQGLIGRPSAQGLLTGSGWYYVGSRWEHYGMNPPKEIDRQVVAISFDEAGTVTNVERFGLERGRIVVLSQRVTDSGVSGASVLRQLFANIGKFNPGQMFD